MENKKENGKNELSVISMETNDGYYEGHPPVEKKLTITEVYKPGYHLKLNCSL